jgi:hypothetical protein
MLHHTRLGLLQIMCMLQMLLLPMLHPIRLALLNYLQILILL